MRFVLILITLVVTSLLVMKSFPGANSDAGEVSSGEPLVTPVQKASEVNQLVLDAANQQRQALEAQIEQ